MNHSHSPPTGSRSSTLPQDALASVVVFLVALPLCMGIAIASGVPAGLGLITGIIGGIVVGAFSGAPLLVSGPAAGLSVLVWEIVQAHGLASLGAIVLVAGLFQVGFGLLRIGPWFRAISPAVVHGMLAGIGVLIVASQFHVMVDDVPKGSGLQNLVTIPLAVWKAAMPVDGSNHHLAAAIGLLTIVVLLAWNAWMAKRLKAVPGPLVAVVAGSVAAAASGLPVNYVAVPDALFEGVQFPTLALFEGGRLWAILGTGLAVAVIASAETLLSAVAVDKMHTGPRARFDRELVAQGIGNGLCGLVGALPMTGVIVRSSANVQAGAKTRLSPILHGMWILAFVLLFPDLLRLIPVASLAAILVYTGCKLVDVKVIKELARFGKSEVAIYFVTLGAIVTTNLLEGILIGLGAVVLKLLYTLSRLKIDVESDADGQRVTLHLSGCATFLGLPMLAAELERHGPAAEVHVRLDRLTYVDHACFDLLVSWEKQHVQSGGRMVIEWDHLQRIYARGRSMARLQSTL